MDDDNDPFFFSWQKKILTGSSDGLIRLCSIFPNKLLGVIGSHDDFPVESMKVCIH